MEHRSNTQLVKALVYCCNPFKQLIGRGYETRTPTDPVSLGYALNF